jgi:hypothetical protein
MTRATQRPIESRRPIEAVPLGVGLLAAGIATATRVVLTANMGTTYHLFPFVVAASLGVMARLGGPSMGRAEAGAAAAGGLIAVAVGWSVMVALDETSSATFVADQPGGVAGETAVFAVLGAVFSLWWTLRRAS